MSLCVILIIQGNFPRFLSPQHNLRLGLPSPLLDKIGTQAAKLLQDFINAQDAPSACSTTAPPNFWCPSSSLSFKKNFERAVFSSFHSIGMGVVIRNGHGEVISAMAEHIPLPNSIPEQGRSYSICPPPPNFKKLFYIMYKY